jgi:raw
MTDVFLGGACSPTTWRQDIAIPRLKAAGITYYNPQVDKWYPTFIQIEARARTEACGLLFVLSGETRGVATLVEATEGICTHQTVWLVIEDIHDGLVIDGHEITGRELENLNHARQYLADVARRYGVRVFSTVEDAVESIVSLFGSKEC